MYLDNAFILGVNWLIDLVQTLSGVWSTLSTPFLVVGNLDISLLSVVSVGAVVAVLTVKMIDIINPIG